MYFINLLVKWHLSDYKHPVEAILRWYYYNGGQIRFRHVQSLTERDYRRASPNYCGILLNADMQSHA